MHQWARPGRTCNLISAKLGKQPIPTYWLCSLQLIPGDLVRSQGLPLAKRRRLDVPGEATGAPQALQLSNSQVPIYSKHREWPRLRNQKYFFCTGAGQALTVYVEQEVLNRVSLAALESAVTGFMECFVQKVFGIVLSEDDSFAALLPPLPSTAEMTTVVQQLATSMQSSHKKINVSCSTLPPL